MVELINRYIIHDVATKMGTNIGIHLLFGIINLKENFYDI